jgi:hypothetical protein
MGIQKEIQRYRGLSSKVLSKMFRKRKSGQIVQGISKEQVHSLKVLRLHLSPLIELHGLL